MIYAKINIFKLGTISNLYLQTSSSSDMIAVDFESSERKNYIILIVYKNLEKTKRRILGIKIVYKTNYYNTVNDLITECYVINSLLKIQLRTYIQTQTHTHIFIYKYRNKKVI